ncbi:hypothetical protein [Streptomyces sp. NPDC058773]|uniref:hypothetical protein n=1 Tax=Streptomyces sp. NPDC058773 TaxID=3346632 RepID=UPI003694EE3E
MAPRRVRITRIMATTCAPTSTTHRYVQSVRLDGTGHDRTYLTTGDLRSGHELAFTVGPKPSGWGTGDHAAPPPVGTASAAQQQSDRHR